MPPDKKIKFASLREDLLSHKSVSLKSLQKFFGKINSFTLVVPAARLFSRAACLAMSRASRSARAIPVSRELKAELELWRFLDSWSGFLPWRDEKHSQLDVFSDALDSGWGGILRLPDQPQQELHGHWDLSERDLPIVVKETLALLYVLRRVAGLISNARIYCFVDNATLVACWKKDGSRNTRVTDALKEIFHLTLSTNLQVTSSLPNKIRQILPLAFPQIETARSAVRLGSWYNEHLARTPSILWLPLRTFRKILLVGHSLFLHHHPYRKP